MDGWRGKEGIGLAGVSPDRESQEEREWGQARGGPLGGYAMDTQGRRPPQDWGWSLRHREVTRLAPGHTASCWCVCVCGGVAVLTTRLAASQAPLCTADAALCPQARRLWGPGRQVRGQRPPPASKTWLSSAAAAGSPGQSGVGVPGRGARGSARGTAALAITPGPHQPGTRSAVAFLALRSPPQTEVRRPR